MGTAGMVKRGEEGRGVNFETFLRDLHAVRDRLMLADEDGVLRCAVRPGRGRASPTTWPARSSPTGPRGAADPAAQSRSTWRSPAPTYSWRGRAILCSGSVRFSSHWASQPGMRPMANSTGNISVGKPMAS
jgi:hypothetical protein